MRFLFINGNLYLFGVWFSEGKQRPYRHVMFKEIILPTSNFYNLPHIHYSFNSEHSEHIGGGDSVEEPPNMHLRGSSNFQNHFCWCISIDFLVHIWDELCILLSWRTWKTNRITSTYFQTWVSWIDKHVVWSFHFPTTVVGRLQLDRWTRQYYSYESEWGATEAAGRRVRRCQACQYSATGKLRIAESRHRWRRVTVFDWARPVLEAHVGGGPSTIRTATLRMSPRRHEHCEKASKTSSVIKGGLYAEAVRL